MKIAMIGHKRVPSREGGVEIVVEEISKRIARKGHTIDIYNRWEMNNKIGFIDDDTGNIRIVNIPTFKNSKLNAIIYSFFATIRALFGKYDIIHYHSEGPSSMIWLPKLLGMKVVCTNHGLDWQRAKWGRFATTYLKFGETLSAKYSNKLIVLSESIRDYFKEEYDCDAIKIPNGINNSEKRLADRILKNWNLNQDSYILFLARIVPEKGLEYLIEAFKEIKTDKILIIAGKADSNEYLNYLKKKCGDLLGTKILFVGFVQGEIINELYSNAYLYVLPSDIEGMPISLLEAMSFGNAVLVSDISENKDVVQNMGVTFQRANVSDLAQKLQELIINEKGIIQFLKENSKDFIINRYNWDDVAERTYKIYEGVINETI